MWLITDDNVPNWEGEHDDPEILGVAETAELGMQYADLIYQDRRDSGTTWVTSFYGWRKPHSCGCCFTEVREVKVITAKIYQEKVDELYAPHKRKDGPNYTKAVQDLAAENKPLKTEWTLE